MTEFQPAIIENGSYKRTKVETFKSTIRNGLGGDAVQQMLDAAEEKGFIAIPLKQRDMQQYVSLRNTFLERCRKAQRIYVEVFVDEKSHRAYARFDTISLPDGQQKFKFNEFILKIKLKTYYKRLTNLENRGLSLPAGLSPYSRSQHKINFFILPKQICFSFYQNHPEIFNFVLNKIKA